MPKIPNAQYLSISLFFIKETCLMVVWNCSWELENLLFY